jgi:diguanylate cyclase (GGDEF)-like protein/PAS domain S-box-containing protein
MLHTILITTLIFGALGCFILAFLAWQQRPATSAMFIAVLLTAGGVYAIGYSLELTGTDLNEMLLAIRLEYLGIVQIAPLWMSLALHYANHTEWIKPQRLILLWVIPIIVLASVFTNSYHHLFYSSISIDQTGAFPTLHFDRGPIYWLHVTYVYIIFAAAAILLTHQYRLPHVLYRRQAKLMMGCSLFVIIVTGLHLSGLIPLPNIDINPFAMIISSSVLGWGILNLRLIELTPVARDTLFETLKDGVLVLDAQQRVVDFNPAAGKYISLPADAVGQKLVHLLPAELQSIFNNLTPDGAYLEISLDQPKPHHFELFYDSLREQNDRQSGSLVVLHDITRRKEAEARLEQTLYRYRMLTENSNDVIWTMDTEGHFTYVSPAIERLRGFTPQEVLLQTMEEAFCAGSLELIKDNLQRTLRAASIGQPETPEYLEVEQPCKNGGSIWTEITTRLVLGEHGQPTEFIGISRDIRERKLMQDQIKQTLDELRRFNDKLQAQMNKINSLQAQLREQAIRDPLTNCYNRRYLDETIGREFARAAREAYPISLLMVDIDHFKQINDLFGHPSGDLVLRGIGQLLRSRVRAGDIVCRYGGDEFLMLLPNMGLEDALRRAEDCRGDVTRLEVAVDSGRADISASVGVACYPIHGMTPDEVIQMADQALYLAKASGRNSVRAPA